jgi:hypothetical protein
MECSSTQTLCTIWAKASGSRAIPRCKRTRGGAESPSRLSSTGRTLPPPSAASGTPAHCVDLLARYDDGHAHGGLATFTPAEVHFGRGERHRTARETAMDAAFEAHPLRSRRGRPVLGACRRNARRLRSPTSAARRLSASLPWSRYLRVALGRSLQARSATAATRAPSHRHRLRRQAPRAAPRQGLDQPGEEFRARFHLSCVQCFGIVDTIPNVRATHDSQRPPRAAPRRAPGPPAGRVQPRRASLRAQVHRAIHRAGTHLRRVVRRGRARPDPATDARPGGDWPTHAGTAGAGGGVQRRAPQRDQGPRGRAGGHAGHGRGVDRARVREHEPRARAAGRCGAPGRHTAAGSRGAPGEARA